MTGRRRRPGGGRSWWERLGWWDRGLGGVAVVMLSYVLADGLWGPLLNPPWRWAPALVMPVYTVVWFVAAMRRAGLRRRARRYVAVEMERRRTAPPRGGRAAGDNNLRRYGAWWTR